MEMLLERSVVNADIADRDGRTPLSLATAPMYDSWRSEEAWKKVIRMLLERNDVNPDSADKCGRTPLSWAARYGQGEIVRMLLERTDVNPDTADKSGRTPLSWAAENGNEEIVRMLLERNDVNPTLRMRAAERHFYGLLGWGLDGVPRKGVRGL